MKTKYIIGSRGSRLALRQSALVQTKLQQIYPKIDFEIKTISTAGDRERDKKFSEINTEGIFIKDLELALLGGEIDFAVHSFKDLPTKLPAELEAAAVVDQANPLDVLAGAAYKIANLPRGARLGTGSLRRKSQLLAYRSDLEIVAIRGNIETRLEKIKSENLSGVILAAAGLERLGLESQITEYLAADICLPAARQGAVVAEIRKKDQGLKRILKELETKEMALKAWTEYEFLKEIQAGCHAPAAAQVLIEAGKLKLTAAVGEIDGSRIIKREKEIKQPDLDSAQKLARQTAAEIMAAGGSEIIFKLKNT